MSAVEEQFEAIYREQYRRVVGWVYWNLPPERLHLAEDYAQETFHDLWVHLQKGRPVEYPFALLKKIARRRLADFYVAQKAAAVTDAVDFTDPATVVVERVHGHRYAMGDPEMALLAEALWEAMERMREASERWRSLHALTGKMRPLGEEYPLFRGKLSRKLRQEAARDKAHADRDEALAEFQAVCAEVGQLRAELERLGGRDWKSATGWPPPACRGEAERSRKTTLDDPTVTECSKGHPLRLDTVGFLEDGTRTCRECSTAAGRRWAAKKKATATT